MSGLGVLLNILKYKRCISLPFGVYSSTIVKTLLSVSLTVLHSLHVILIYPTPEYYHP